MERLEKAAHLLMASPEQVTNEQRHEAEQLFMQLRQTRSPFNLCKEILETSQVPYLLFEAASLLRVAIIREWRELSDEDRLQLRHYIMQYVMARPHLLHYVRETLVQVVAIMVKRGSVEDGGAERGELLSEVEVLIQDPDNNKRGIGCSMMSAIMQEYAVTVKSTDVGITWETHFKAKKQFEGTDLKRIFSLVVRLLREGVEAGGGAEGGGRGGKLAGEQGELRTLLLRMLVLAESTLTWTFISLHLPKRLMSVFEQDQNPSLRPGPQWEEVFKDTSLLHLFFQAYWLVRSDWELGHHALNCLVQLASLNGVALINKQSRVHYLTSYLNCFFSLLSSVEVRECEALGFSHIFRKLLQFFPPSILVELPYDLLNSLVDHLTALTCQFAQRAAAEEHAELEDQVYMEAFEQVLHSWTCILQEASSCFPGTSYTITSGGSSLSSVIRTFTDSVAAARAQHDSNLARRIPSQSPRADDSSSSHSSDNNNSNQNNLTSLRTKIKEGATLIFDTYLKCHLAPPDGTRHQVDSNEISETAPNDRQLYKDQLQLLGLSARQNVEHCIPVLTELLEQRTALLRTYLAQALHNPSQRSTDALDNLYEDLHWLVLITCHVVTTDNESEASLIPSELVHYSIKCSATVDVSATLALLAAPQSMPADMNAPPAMQPNPTIDPLIRIMGAVLRLCQTETEAIKANMKELLSPELSCTLIWFLKRFCLSYLLPNESFYAELSMALSSAFGRDSEGAAWALEFLLSCVERTLRHRTAEHVLVEDTIALLSAMADHRERGQLLVKSKSLVEVVQLQQSGHLAALSSSASRGLMQGLVLLAGSVAQDSSTREEVWQHVLDPLIRGFHALLDHADFTANYQMDNYRKQILHQMDNFTGAVQGCLMGTAASLFERLAPSLAGMVRLLDLYHNYPEIVEAIMEVYVECGRRLLCFLSPGASKQLYEGAVQLVRVYAKHNIGRRTVASEGEQDQWRDVQLLMELLTSLLSKDFIDLAPSRPDGEEEEVVAAADVCLYGLNIIMPLMSRELLQIPTLCSHYYKMVTFIVEIYPSKIGDLPPDLIKNLLGSIELGLTVFGPDVSSYCFDFLFVLTTHVFKHKAPDSDIRRALQPFLKLVLDLILSQQVNSDLLQAASASLYILICCFQSEYRSLVGQLLATQGDPATSARLAQAFTQLTENVELTAERAHKFKFRNNFEEFIANVRGFLFVK